MKFYKLSKYLFYRILNYFLIIIFTRKNYPLLRVLYSNKKDNNTLSLHFDFTDSSTHFGDRLFFFPLIINLKKSGFSISISNDDVYSKLLLEKLYDFSIPISEANKSDFVIYPSPSFFNFIHLYSNAILVDFTDTSSFAKVSNQLLRSFGDFFSCEFNYDCKVIPNFSYYPYLDKNQKYFLFSNYINSGLFRKFFIDEKKLINQLLLLKKDGFKIVHVGSREDALGIQTNYPYVDLDFRGMTSIIDMVDLVCSPNVYGAVSYDNFLMHLIGLFDKKAYILFRGRFFKKNITHHMNYINNTFFKPKNNIHYL